MLEVILLIVSLLAILASAEIFTNGVECLGRSLSLSQAVVGSILAAVGTALPETILPFVAILLHSGEASNQIGVGAILGAPFMLSTIAFSLVGLTASIGYLRKRRSFAINIEVDTMKRDLVFFLVMYCSAIFLPMLWHEGKIFVAVALVVGYILYAYRTFREESSGILHADELYIRRLWHRAVVFFMPNTCPSNTPAGTFIICTQVVFALSIMIGGAHMFVDLLSKLSLAWGINPMLFALLVAPVATELPEKFNSVTWTIKGRDTLAMGNITGAMVFQSTFPVSLGLIFTNWEISGLALTSAVMAILSSVFVLANICLMKRLSPLTALTGVVFYLIYGVMVIMGHTS